MHELSIAELPAEQRRRAHVGMHAGEQCFIQVLSSFVISMSFISLIIS